MGAEQEPNEPIDGTRVCGRQEWQLQSLRRTYEFVAGGNEHTMKVGYEQENLCFLISNNDKNVWPSFGAIEFIRFTRIAHHLYAPFHQSNKFVCE